MSARSGLGGFSLIELLVVIAIVGLLIGILLPALAAARRAARTAVGASHQRTLLLATFMYQSEARGHYPRASQGEFNRGSGPNSSSDQERAAALWFNALDHYLASAVQAYDATDIAARNYDEFKQDPAWFDIPDDPPGARQENRTFKMNDAFNGFDFNEPVGARPFVHENDVKQPGNTVVYLDGRAADLVDDPVKLHFDASPGDVGLRHAGGTGANVAFADGHVRLVVQAIKIPNPGDVPRWFTEAEGKQELIFRLK